MSEKNRNGKPTAFQIATLEGLVKKANNGDVKIPKTYREAENAIRRLRNYIKKHSQKKELYKVVSNGNGCAYHQCKCKKDAADKLNIKVDGKPLNRGTPYISMKGKLPYIKNGTDTQTVKIPLDAKEKAQVISVLNDFTSMLKEFEKSMDVMMSSAMKMFPF